MQDKALNLNFQLDALSPRLTSGTLWADLMFVEFDSVHGRPTVIGSSPHDSLLHFTTHRNDTTISNQVQSSHLSSGELILKSVSPPDTQSDSELRHVTSLIIFPTFLSQLSPYWSRLQDRLSHIPPLIQDSDLSLSIHSFRDLMNSRPFLKRLHGKFYATYIIATLLDRYSLFTCDNNTSHPPLSYATLNSTLGHIADSISDPALETSQLASMAGVSTAIFRKRFKQSICRPIHQSIIDVRIELAKFLLSQSTLPIGKIALDVGCFDQSHFNHLFHQRLGMTPGRYRMHKHQGSHS